MTLKINQIKNKRIVVLGKSGIVASNLLFKLDKFNLKNIPIGRSKVNLKQKGSYKKLRKIIKNGDIIIFVAAEAPVKNIEMFFNNLKICKTVCNALESKKIEYLIYLSSDAVYKDVKEKISEKSITSPNSLHGLMHLTRETMLKDKFRKILCILRPTLIYGPGDSHNGYGPNRFIKLALQNKPISVFGNGEERRDHVYIDNLINIIIKCIIKKRLGIFNIASGKVCSFKHLAKKIITLSKSKSKLKKIKRKGPMPHNGYRPFNINLIKNNFKNVKMFSIDNGIKKYLENSLK